MIDFAREVLAARDLCPDAELLCQISDQERREKVLIAYSLTGSWRATARACVGDGGLAGVMLTETGRSPHHAFMEGQNGLTFVQRLGGIVKEPSDWLHFIASFANINEGIAAFAMFMGSRHERMVYVVTKAAYLANRVFGAMPSPFDGYDVSSHPLIREFGLTMAPPTNAQNPRMFGCPEVFMMTLLREDPEYKVGLNKTRRDSSFVHALRTYPKFKEWFK